MGECITLMLKLTMVTFAASIAFEFLTEDVLTDPKIMQHD